jgi:hypothetical protein
VATLEGHTRCIRSVAVACGRIYTASDDKTVKVWDATTHVEVTTLKGHTRAVYSVAVAYGRIYTASKDETVKVCDAATHAEVATLKFDGMCFHVLSRGDSLVVAHGNTISIVPHQTALNQGTIASCMLKLMVDVDKNDADPKKRFDTARSAIQNGHKRSLLSSQLFFLNLAKEGTEEGLKRCLFDIDFAITPIPFSQLLVAAEDSKECLRLILTHAAESIANRNSVVDNVSTAKHQYAFVDDADFVQALLHIGHPTRFPDLLYEFLSKAPLLRMLPVFDGPVGGIKVKMKEDSMAVFPADSTFKAAFFDQVTKSELLRGRIPSLKTKSVATFSRGFAAGGYQSFIYELLRHRTDDGTGYGTKFFGTLTVATVVEHKWLAYGQRLFYVDAMLYVLSLVMIVAASFTVGHFDFPSHRFDSTGGQGVAWLLGVVGGCCALEVWQEGWVIARGGAGGPAAYFREVMTWLRLVQLGLSIATVVTFFAGGNTFVRVLAYTVFLKWFGLYNFFQALPQIGAVVMMIASIFSEILDILAAMVVAVLAFGNTALLLSNDIVSRANTTHFVGFDNWRTALYTSYKALVLVDFDELVDDGDYTTLTQLLLFLSTLMTSVVLLNLLIARMSDSYERIQEVAEMAERRLKAKIIVRFEMMMSTHDDPNKFPEHVVALLAPDRNHGTIKTTKWAGVLNELNSKNAAMESRAKTEIDALKREVAEINTKVDSEMEEVNIKIDSMKQELNIKMDNILALLQTTSRATGNEARLGFVGE